MRVVPPSHNPPDPGPSHLTPIRLVAVRFDARDPARLADFWAGVLGREVIAEDAAGLLPGDRTQVGLRFAAAPGIKSGPNPVHLHLTSQDPERQAQTVQAVLDLGGRHIDVGQAPDADYVVLADPEGNEFCVMDPGDTWLAGTGFLGEVTCVGSRAVGFFWRDVLGWPLVWDRGEQTAIQSPQGGTKLSWDAEGMAPKAERNRQGFDLDTADPDAEVERLVRLGATRLDGSLGPIRLLADPDGNEFSVASR
jgi:catechol 2,3-dioxygenase-like lactoylglutathione lyase family enzyme